MADALTPLLEPIKPLPKSLGACVDRLYALREERLRKQQGVDSLKEQERQLEDHLIRQLSKQDSQGVLGRKAKAKVLTKAHASVTDWEAFYTYVHQHKAYELLQRRVADQAIKERWEAGESVPGVDRFNQVKISLTKL